MIIGTALIVLTWLLLVAYIQTWACVLITVFGGFVILFGMLFGVYFFNLDMKMMTLLEPLFQKHYDKRKRNRKI